MPRAFVVGRTGRVSTRRATLRHAEVVIFDHFCMTVGEVGVAHEVSRSSARLSVRTLTRGLPR